MTRAYFIETASVYAGTSEEVRLRGQIYASWDVCYNRIYVTNTTTGRFYSSVDIGRPYARDRRSLVGDRPSLRGIFVSKELIVI